MSGIKIHSPHIELGVSLPLRKNSKPAISLGASDNIQAINFAADQDWSTGFGINGMYNFDNSAYRVGGFYSNGPIVINGNYTHFNKFSPSLDSLVVNDDLNKDRISKAKQFLTKNGRDISKLSNQDLIELDKAFHYTSGDNVLLLYDNKLSGLFELGGSINYLNFFKK